MKERGIPMSEELHLKYVREKAEEVHIRTVLNMVNWNRRRAAVVLGISYRTLLYRMTDYRMRTQD